MRHIFNLSFVTLRQSAIDLLSKAGLTRGASWDEESRLPFFDKDMEPEKISALVKEIVNKLDCSSSDVVIVGGLPDVVHYIVDALIEPLPLVLLVLGRASRRQSKDDYRVYGFREVLPHGKVYNTKAIHVIATDKRL